MKEYMDIAYNGEPAIVSRKHKRDVVFVSETEYDIVELQNIKIISCRGHFED